MADQWSYDGLRRRWVAAVPNPTEPAPTAAPVGTPYGDWPRCVWPSGCTIGCREGGLCGPHSELVLAYGHVAKPDGPPGATSSWQRCADCGVRGAMHRKLGALDVAALEVWLEEHDRAELSPPPPPSETVRRTLAAGEVDTINMHHPTPPRRYADASPFSASDFYGAGIGTPTPPAQLTEAHAYVQTDATDTSTAAAVKAALGSGTQRRRILQSIVDSADDGLTDEEGQRLLGIGPNSYPARRLELQEAGYVCDSGDRRPTLNSGSAAIVWLPTLAGLQALADA